MADPLHHAPGTPAWVDHQSADPDASRAFYSAVFGWTWEVSGPEFGGYANAFARGKPVAGLGPLTPGAPPTAAWSVYLASTDAAGDADRIQAAGGAVIVPAMKVGSFGHMAVATDPTGAAFGLWQPLSHPGFQAMGTHGAPCWFEVNTPDAPKLRDFYSGLWGHETQKLEGMDYVMIVQGGRPRHGVMQMTEAWEGIPPHWMTYFAHDDVDAAVKVIVEQGGAVKHGPFDTPFGRMAVCADPAGAIFTAMTPAQAAT
jgi:predicted enzyme related to lactoylglutathione lyase